MFSKLTLLQDSYINVCCLEDTHVLFQSSIFLIPYYPTQHNSSRIIWRNTSKIRLLQNHMDRPWSLTRSSHMNTLRLSFMRAKENKHVPSFNS